MNPQGKKQIGLTVNESLDFGAKEVKESIKILLELFKDSVKIPAFLNKLTDKEFNASDLLEKVI